MKVVKQKLVRSTLFQGEEKMQIRLAGFRNVRTFVESWIMTTFGNKIQVSDPTDACFLFLYGIPAEETYY